MKRIQYHRYGGPSEMRLEEFDPPAPGPNQVMVRVKAAAANPVDWKIRNGALKFMTGKRFPRAMGSDFSGVVEAVGPSVASVAIGDEVIGSTPMGTSGAFAELAVTNENLVVKKPQALSFEEAAALPIVGATAWSGLVGSAKLRPGQSVFVHGCLGGVGRVAVQLAQMLGASVAGSCRQTGLAEARALGVDPVVDFTQLDLGPLKGRFDVVFDTAGTLSTSEGAALLKRGGVILEINPSGAKLLPTLLSPRRKLVFGNPTRKVLEKVVQAAAERKITPLLGKTAPLSEAIPALAELEQAGLPKGKLVIVPG